MSVKPSMLKDDFTEKYYLEENPHNKVLFNPDKAAVTMGQKKKRFKLPETMGVSSLDLVQSRVNVFEAQKGDEEDGYGRSAKNMPSVAQSMETIGLGDQLQKELNRDSSQNVRTENSLEKRRPGQL